MHLPVDTILEGHVTTVLKTLPPASIDALVTSPTYWKLRDYGIANHVWGGLPQCPHGWMSDGFCKRCAAWRGQLGLEPAFDLYITHLCDVFDEIKRVLKPSGTCWINLGDTYSDGATRALSGSVWTDGPPCQVPVPDPIAACD